MPSGPARQQEAVADVPEPEVVLREEHVGGPIRRHEEERHERDRHHHGEHSVLYEVLRARPGATDRRLGSEAELGVRTSDDDRRHPDDEEGRRIDDHRDLEAAGRREHPADQRADREAGVASRLHPPVREGEPSLPGDARDERELGRLRDGEADAEERSQTEDQRRSRGEGQHDGHGRLRERHDEQHAAGVVAIREEPRRAGENDRRRPERDVQQGDRDPRSGRLLEVERQRDEGEPVPERGQPDRPHEDVQVSAAASHQRTRGGAGSPCASSHETTGFRRTPIRSISHSMTSPGLR